MMMATYSIRILNSSLQLVAILDDYLSLSWTRRWQQSADFSLFVSMYSQAMQYLVADNFIHVLRNGQDEYIGIIEHGEVKLDEQGKASEVWQFRGGGILARRICLPPSGVSHDEQSGAAETVMKAYVNNNAISPTDANRNIPILSNETDSGRGASVAMRARYNKLVEILEEAGVAGGIGWEVVKSGAGLQFKVVPGVNRSTEQSAVAPIIFSPDFGNIKALGYLWSKLAYATLAYVAGQGEAELRSIVQAPSVMVGFTRESMACLLDGTQVASGEARFDDGKFGKALLIEEGTINMLLNSSFEIDSDSDGLADAWTWWNAATVTALKSIDTTNHRQSGSKSQKIVILASTGLGSAVVYQVVSGIVAGRKYTISCHTKGVRTGTGSCYMAIAWRNSEGNEFSWGHTTPDIPPPAEFTRTENTFTAPDGAVSAAVYCYAVANTAGDTVTVHFDDVQFENKPYVTSTVVAADAITQAYRAAETLTIIPTAGVFAKGNWSVEFIYTPVAPILGHPTDHHLWRIHIGQTTDTGNNYLIYVDDETGCLAARVRSGGTSTALIADTVPLVQGTAYFITFTGDGTNIKLYINGAQVGSDTPYTEPVGDLPVNMLIGHYADGAQQPNGLFESIRFGQARTLHEHQAANGVPLEADEKTTCLLPLNGDLEPIFYNYSGLARREIFVDARDLDTDAKLLQRGLAKLAEQGPEEKLEAEILTNGPFEYRSDWDLGDVVTVRNLAWSILAHLRVSAVTVTLEPSTGEQITVAFGAPWPNFLQHIKRAVEGPGPAMRI